MSESLASSSVGNDELAALKLVALEGATAGPAKISCSGLGERLGASGQTASRRLQRLEEGGLIDREVVGDGQWVSLTDAGETQLRAEYADYRRIFEDGPELELRGSVTSGMGEGRHYISLPGYMTQFRERLGYEPFPGTLNVSLDEASVRSRAELESIVGVPIDGWEDEDRTYGPATCYAATVATGALDAERWHPATADGEAAAPGGDQRTFASAHVIVPDRTHHDEGQLEVIAPERLRDELGLVDDDGVAIRIEEAGGEEA